jgi:hypothetical protein
MWSKNISLFNIYFSRRKFNNNVEFNNLDYVELNRRKRSRWEIDKM